jgi:hypothetical protein
MKIIDIAAAELTFNFFKFGFYYKPYGEETWTRLPFCFSWSKAKNLVAEYQIRKCLAD